MVGIPKRKSAFTGPSIWMLELRLKFKGLRGSKVFSWLGVLGARRPYDIDLGTSWVPDIAVEICLHYRGFI